MKRITMMTLFALAAFVSVGKAMAQDHAVEANIPFHFTVGDKVLPSGSYTITSDSTSPYVIVIRNGEQRFGIMSTVYADSKASKKNVLVFNRYGDQYFLHEVLCTTAGMNLEIPATKFEKKAQTHQASLHGGDLGGDDQVLIALK